MFFVRRIFRFDIEPRRLGMGEDYIAKRLAPFAPHVHLIHRFAIDMRLYLKCFPGEDSVQLDISHRLAQFTRAGGPGFEREAVEALIAELETFRAKGAVVEEFSRNNVTVQTWLLMQRYGRGEVEN